MTVRLTFVIAAMLATLAARPAHAIRACSAEGIAPAPGSTLPPRGRFVVYGDYAVPELRATIDGKAVKLKRTPLPGSVRIKVVLFEVQSAATGKLELTMKNGYSMGQYLVGKTTLPTELPVTTDRMYRPGTWGTAQTPYNFDGLAIRLPKDAPAIYAHVKIRRDDKAAWSELDVPVYTEVSKAQPTPEVWLGEVGCSSNYSQQLLEKGVDIEVTIILTDGTRLPVKGLDKHYVLPPHP